MRERILVTGGSGLLGSNITRIIAKDYEVYATYNSRRTLVPGCKFIPLDVSDQKSVISVFRHTKPHLVIHAAALVNVDYCEKHPSEAWTINVAGTENVAEASRKIGAKLIYISTDSVFNGERGMYREEDIPLPVNTYARTKLAGENRVRQLVPDSITARTAFYGWSLHKQTSLSEWVVGSLRENEHINMFTDVFFSPIFIDDLTRLMIKMYRYDLSGVYHAGSREWCSKYDFGVVIAESFGYNAANISPGSVEGAGFRAPRPKNLSLSVTKLFHEGCQLPGIREGVERFKELEPEINTLREMQCEE